MGPPPRLIALTMIRKGAVFMTDQSHATSTTTAVFALLRAKPGVTRERVMAIMPAEIRATVQLYLDGNIREWYSLEDVSGGVFLIYSSDYKNAQTIMASFSVDLYR